MSLKTERTENQLEGQEGKVKGAEICDRGGERCGATMGVCGWVGLEEGT